MPLKLNLGLSRKVGEVPFGSRGASVNLEFEVDSSLIDDRAKFLERVRQLFGWVRVSLAAELDGSGANTARPGLPAHARPEIEPSPATNGNNQTAMARTDPPRLATNSQVKAIYGIARRRQIDLTPVLAHIGVGRPNDLSIREASQLIDQLQTVAIGASSANGHDSGRD